MGFGRLKEKEGREGWRETDTREQLAGKKERKKKNCREMACCLAGALAPSNRNRECDSELSYPANNDDDSSYTEWVK